MTDPPDDSKVVRLGREDQMAIARGLRDWYQHVVDEGIPEHMQAGLAKLFSAELSQDNVAGVAGTDLGPDRAEEPKTEDPKGEKPTDPEREPPPGS
jgi:hypothetical protein